MCYNMWVYLWLITASAAIILGDTTIPPVKKSIGDILPTTVQTSPYDSFICKLKTPANDTIQFLPTNTANPDKYELRMPPNLMNGCSVNIRVTDADDEGLWQLFIELDDGTIVRTAEFNLVIVGIYEHDQTTTEHTVVEPEDLQIEELESQIIRTYIGAKHIITIKYYEFVYTESCHLIDNNGILYNQGDKLSKVEVNWINDTNVACGVEVYVADENMIGNWILFSRAKRYSSTPIEKNQPFTIYVEEYIKASPEVVTIAVGKDLHVRLADPAPYELQDTCMLVGGNEDYNSPYERDQSNIETCGFIIRNIQVRDSGLWHIILGNRIIYKAPIQVTVNGDPESSESYLKWEMDSSVDMLVGPEDAIYCRVTNPAGRTVFEQFDRCRITLDRVTQDHKGIWVLFVGAQGKITTNIYRIIVDILEVQRPRVITHVERQPEEILLSCSLPEGPQVRTCMFRDPIGRILLTAEGVGEDRYSYHGDNVRLASNVSTTGCGLRITNPTVNDYGFWRCAMATENNQVYYGFLLAASPTAIAQKGPTLTPKEPKVIKPEGDAVTMSCSIPSEIQYCYFRARNGTVFNMNPGLSTDSMQYVGAGFQAGECGVRFNSLSVTDSGRWSCHVGLLRENSTTFMPEERANFTVLIEPIMIASQILTENKDVVLFTEINQDRAVDYCRYVRIDGLGFTEDFLPYNVVKYSDTRVGRCNLHIENPSILDNHPWTIVVRITGQREEISRVTSSTLELPPSPPTPPPPRPQPPPRSGAVTFWFAVTMLSIVFVFVGLMISTENSRRWTSQKTAAIRNSFKKKPTQNTGNTPVQAA